MSTRISRRTILLFAVDIVIVGAGLILALYLRLGLDGALFQLNENNGWYKVGLVTLICLSALYFYDLYDFTVMHNRRELNARLIQALGSGWVLLAVVFYFSPTLQIGRGTALYSMVITLVMLLAFRIWIHFLLGHPGIGEKILIVGDAELVIDTAEAVLRRRDFGLRISGFITDNFGAIKRRIPEARHLGNIVDLEEIVERERIDCIVIGVRERRGALPPEVLLRLRLAGRVSIEECTSFFERVTGRVHLDMLHPSWLIYSQRSRDTQLTLFSRDIIYRILALIGLTLSFPFALLTAILIKLESEGSFFYKQQRVGKNGRVFELLKFRSMKIDAEADGPVWASSGDNRTTLVGRVIRKIRIDEIPQFWNIIKGDMNFIGPRPERPHFVSKLAEEVPYYELRHLVAPGLTGWAQIKYPYGASVEDARKKLQYDLYYIKNQTLALDVMIFFETVKTVLFGKGGR
ncbi:MAG: TIGR03013 family PEP-CTERM/XrtA system glycosyltransferase [Saprospiraceae bacterium]|nr:TIGR03013 family PEP-CTERM/XrtA system glycosyltransferase [Pyrinomonadaceae bacterium]